MTEIHADAPMRPPRPRARAPRPGPVLRRHVRRSLRGPLLVAVAVFALSALLADLVMLSDLVVNHDFGPAQVARIAALRLLPVVGQILPFAFLVAAMAALGRLVADREVLAMETAGISPRALVRPVLVAALLPTAVGLGLSLELAPRANAALHADLVAAAQERPGARLARGGAAAFGDLVVQAREVSPDGERLRAVVLWAPARGETVFARRAWLSPRPGGATRLDLEDGMILAGRGEIAGMVRFGRLEETLRGAAEDVEVADPLAVRGAAELAGALRSADPPARAAAAAELQRRVALPLATLLLGALAVPLALGRLGGSRAAGILLGLAATVAYYALVQLGEGLVRSGRVPVALALAVPDLALLLLAGVGLVHLGGRPGETRAGRARGRARARRGPAPLRAGRRLLLDRYVLKRFAALAALCLVALVLASLLVDVLDNLKWFTRYGSTPTEVLRYYAARAPILGSRMLPLALVAGAALAMGLLAATGELGAMRACGIAPWRTLLPLLLACALVAGLYGELSNRWVPRASAAASRIKHTEIKDRSLVRHDVWQREDGTLVVIDRLDPLRGQARGVTLYELAPDGLPRSRTDAASARHLGGGTWELEGAVRHAVGGLGLELLPAPRRVGLGDALPAEVDTGDLPLTALRARIHEAEADGYDARRFRVDLHARLAAPLACLVLPALVLLFAGAGPPFPSPAGVLVWGLVLALVHGLLAAVASALGYGGALPPVVAGWAPVLAVAVVGAWLAARLGARARAA